MTPTEMKGYKNYTATEPVDQLREYQEGSLIEGESDDEIVSIERQKHVPDI